MNSDYAATLLKIVVCEVFPVVAETAILPQRVAVAGERNPHLRKARSLCEAVKVAMFCIIGLKN
jgi:heme exporter protein D